MKGSVDASASIKDGKKLNVKQTKENLSTWVGSLGI